MQEYKVARAMVDGAKEYARGDTRSLSPSDAKPLLDMGALIETPQPKRETKPGEAAETKTAKG